MGGQNGFMTPVGPVLVLSFLFLLSSCSIFHNPNRRPVGEDSGAMDSSMVPRAQYDQLLSKYELLLKEKRDLQEQQRSAASTGESQGEEVVKAVPFAGAETAEVPELSETVHMDAGEAPVAPEPGPEHQPAPLPLVESEPGPIPGPSSINDQNMDEEIQALAKARGQLEAGNFSEAMKILQRLEKSSSRQIQVRAKFSIGELLLQQKEHDLALQVFEDIIHNYAFSGWILKALEKLVLCTEALKLEQKRAKYFSLLKDIFKEG